MSAFAPIDVGALRLIAKFSNVNVGAGRATAGHNWLGLRENADYIVAGFSETPLLPGITALLLALGTLIAAWRREGR